MFLRSYFRLPIHGRKSSSMLTPRTLARKKQCLIRGHGALGFDVRENIPRDVALENLKFCHERVLRPALHVSQFGYLPSDEI